MLRPDETEIKDAAQRIHEIVTNDLDKVAHADGGWSTLYLDQGDGRYWELVYLQSHMHGGGPPTLRVIKPVDAASKYMLYVP